MAAAAPLAPALAQNKNVPVGLELYSVRNELGKDLKGTVTAVAKMGYQVVEFYSPYFSLDGRSDERCPEIDGRSRDPLPTPRITALYAFKGDGIAKAIELEQDPRAKYIVMASAGQVTARRLEACRRDR